MCLQTLHHVHCLGSVQVPAYVGFSASANSSKKHRHTHLKRAQAHSFEKSTGTLI